MPAASSSSPTTPPLELRPENFASQRARFVSRTSPSVPCPQSCARTGIPSSVANKRFQAPCPAHLFLEHPVSRRSPHAMASRKRSEEHTSELQSRPHIVCRL